MLTAEEQWKIIQEEERRKGGRKKKKTMAEQLEDMGGFGCDPDSEQAITEELERMDTRPPLQSSEVSYVESFSVSRRRLFNSWIFQAKRSKSWIEEKDLPLFFRFALRRPIMDERTFQATLQAMNMQLKIPMGNVRQPHTRPIGKSRELMFGIDVDHERNEHVSRRLIHRLPADVAEDMDKVREDVRRMAQEDDEDMQQLLRRQLWAVYQHVQNGSVPLETAPWHYRDAFSSQDITDEALLICLKQFGIPTDHIPTNERDAHPGSANCPSPSDVESFERKTASIAKPAPEEMRIINELVDYICLYRGGTLQEHEVIPMIVHCLDGFNLEVDVISDILTDLEKDEQMAALLMWEDACENNDVFMDLSSSSSSSEEDNEDSREEQENTLRPAMVVDPQRNGEKDHDAAVASPADESRSFDGPTTEAMDHRDDFKKMEPGQPEPMSLGQPLVGQPAILPGERPTHIPAEEAESRMQPPGTPRPKPASIARVPEDFNSQEYVESDREPFRDRANAGRRRSSSLENGMTTGIWGLLMPTKEARRLAYQLKLPQDTIDEQVRSISPRRLRRRRASYAKTVVTFSKSKRKASTALHGDTPPKSPKHGDHSDLFAREGEDQEAFVLSHFDPDAIRSKDTCMVCPSLPCECAYGPRSEFECPKCLQQPCVCVRPSQVDEVVKTAPSSGIPRCDALKPKLADRTRPDSPKQSVTLLTYLARVLEKDDMLASIKQLERLFPKDTTVADAKAILSHIQQGIDAGENIDMTGDDDREAVRIIKAFVQSSQTLTDYLDQLHREAKGEDPSTASADDCDDGVGGPDIRSGLLKNSSGHEHVPALPSSSVASTAAFPETQSATAKGPVSQANNTALATGAYLPTPDSSLQRLESSCNIEDAVQPSPFQAGTFPDSPTAGQPSRAENHSGSTAGGESSTAGGHASRAEVPPESPAGSPPSSTADLSKQVSDLHVDGEGDTDCDTFGAPLTRQLYSHLPDAGNGEVDTQSPPRPGAKQLPTSNQPPSPRPPVKELPESKPPATPRLKLKGPSNKMNPTAQSCMKSPGFDSLPLWPAQPGLPEKAGKEWLGMTPKKALEHAKKEAFGQRKSLAFYLEERRAVRTRIKKETDYADLLPSYHRFFQSSNGLSGSSGTAITPPLNKLFDKYRGTFDI